VDKEPKVVSTLYLAAEPNAASLARAFVELILRDWGLPEVVDDAALVASELATNAVQATQRRDPSFYVNGVKPPAIIRVQIVLYAAFMMLSVWDRSQEFPAPRPATVVDEGGRGLLIVENLSTRWGCETVHPYGTHKGKIVWAELALPHMPVHPNGLPKRMRGQIAASTPKVTDVRVLQRVRVGLERLLPVTSARCWPHP
jgi:anti-sigma regulatory factor (Ser/Thr protein kinase)